MDHRDVTPSNPAAPAAPAPLVEPWPWGGAWIPLPDGTTLRLLDVDRYGRTWWWRVLRGRGALGRGRLSAQA